MVLYPTRHAVHVAIAGAATAVVGLVSGHAPIVAWGAALVVGVAIARAATLVSVTRIRAAGFEMLWSSPRRVVRAARGREIMIEAEVRNRDSLAARFVGLRVIASNQLGVRIEPTEGEVMASGSLKVKVFVTPKRVGRHGLFGLALELRGAPGLFEVPLTFANPFGIETLPSPYAWFATSAKGGRARLAANASKAGKARGDGTDLRELREYHHGDPFKRIAWRASARKGKLLVREVEREERDLVWLVLDASVEHWAGVPGSSPLDLAIDELAGMAHRMSAQGELVGLIVVASRVLARIEPGIGPTHTAALFETLAWAAGTYDQDRSDLDEADVMSRVLEHLRPLDPRGAGDIPRKDADKLVQRAMAVMAKAPFNPPVPFAQTPRQQAIRRYLAAFGIESPARQEPERTRTEMVLAEQLTAIAHAKHRPTVVVIAAPAPEEPTKALSDALRRLKRDAAEIRWLNASVEPGVLAASDTRPESRYLVKAMLSRVQLSKEKGERSIRKIGVKIVSRHPKRTLENSDHADHER